METLTIPLIPMPAPRPRFSKLGTYNPKKYTDHKRAIALLAKRVFKLTDKPVKLVVFFYMPIPKSWSKKKRLEAKSLIPFGDIDNFSKSVMDALEGVAYENDKQVIELCAKKEYDENPRIEIELRETAKTCDNCIHQPKEGGNYPMECGDCCRFYGDGYITKDRSSI